MTSEATVFLVDDDQDLRDALVWLLESVELTVETFASAHEFLDSYDPERAGCLVLDIRMPGMSGFELQKQLREKDVNVPVIVITGHGDVPMVDQAYRNGAFSFLEKPINQQKFLDDIHLAIKHDLDIRRDRPTDFLVKLKTLTPRENEVMDLIAAGKTMKEIASQLEISIQTCSKHRVRVLEKMNVGNDVELVRLILSADRG